MIQAGKRKKEFADPYTVTGAVTKGNIITKLSLLIMGLGNIAHRQIAKGLMFLVVEIGYIWFMIQSGIYNLSMFPSLGWREQEKVWNEKKSIYEYTAGDQSSLILLYGVATIYITLMFIVVWREAVKSSYKSEVLAKSGKHLNTFKEDFKSLFDQNLHKLLLAAPIMGVLIFTILPLIYNISMAFTNYSKVNDHLVLFDWVGLANFAKILNLNDSIGKQFYSVLTWTITWAIFATALNCPYTTTWTKTLISPMIEPRDTYFVTALITRKSPILTGATIGNTASTIPPVHATPFPPLNFR